jgi:hypothetical protein
MDTLPSLDTLVGGSGPVRFMTASITPQAIPNGISALTLPSLVQFYGSTTGALAQYDRV